MNEVDTKLVSARKEANIARRKEMTAAAHRKGGSEWMYREKTRAEQVEIALTQIIGQFIEEIKGKPLVEVFYHNKETVRRRRDQLSVFQETMGIIKKLAELRDMLKAEDMDTKVGEESTALINDAEKILAKFMEGTKQ